MDKGEQVIAGFWDMLNKMIWLNNHKMKEALKEHKPSEVHCIKWIGENSNSNVTRLAESFRMTTGAITKLTKKLIEKGFIESYKKPDNKKEIYFRLTSRGKAVFDIHEELHKEFIARDQAVFQQITEKEFDYMLRFSELYSKHLDAEMRKLNVDIKSECDKL